VKLAGLFAATAAVLVVLSTRVRDWVVMTDELQYAKLATHIGETLSPLPTLRGVHVSSYAQLYPALLSPFYGTLAAPTAFGATHVVNALLFASAMIPVYLLARQIALSPHWSLVCSLLSIALPWNVESAFVLTESVAYPVFLWTMLAFVRAVAVPSPRRDAVAIAAVALAVLARTQFLVLAGVLPLTVLLQDGPRRALQRHRVLAAACVAAAALFAVLGTRVLGSYSVTATHGSPLPLRAFPSAAEHLDVVALGIGILPLLLGGAWLVTRRTPFGMLALLTVVLVSLEAASYDVRFGGGLAHVRDRYAFYVAPLLLIALVAALRDGVPRTALAGATGFFAVTVLLHHFGRIAGLYVDSPVAVLNGTVADSGGRVFVALFAVVLALAVAVVRIPPRALALGACAFVFVFSAGVAAAAWTRLLSGHGPSGRPVTGVRGLVLDWADRVLPGGAHTAIVPYTVDAEWGRSAVLWWDVEFWNRSVDRAYVVADTWDYAPFPHTELRVDPTTGVIAGTEHAPPYVIASQEDSRLHFAGTRVAQNFNLDVLQVERPYRALWQSHGLDADGWTRPGRRSWIHIFPQPGARTYIQLVVTFERHDKVTTLICGSGDVPLPGDTTGTAPPLPLGPGKEHGERIAGVRVTRVDLGTGQPC
jgi:hypothetical protein